MPSRPKRQSASLAKRKISEHYAPKSKQVKKPKTPAKKKTMQKPTKSTTTEAVDKMAIQMLGKKVSVPVNRITHFVVGDVIADIFTSAEKRAWNRAKHTGVTKVTWHDGATTREMYWVDTKCEPLVVVDKNIYRYLKNRKGVRKSTLADILIGEPPIVYNFKGVMKLTHKGNIE